MAPGPIGSPTLHMNSPYSGCSSPAGSHVYSPEHYEHQLPAHSQQPMGSPPYHHPISSPYQSTIQSPGQYSGHNASTPSPTYSHMDAVDGGVPHLIQFSSAVTSCDGGIQTVFSSEPAIYSVPHAHQQMVDTFTASHHPHNLPSFAHVFETGPLHPHEAGTIPERHSSPESFCSDSGPVTIKQMANEFGIEFYHPPTPPNMVDGPPSMMYAPEMCGPLPPEMCGLLTPLPNHLCPIPTLSNQGRRSKSMDNFYIETTSH